jgi:hypothetical protein
MTNQGQSERQCKENNETWRSHHRLFFCSSKSIVDNKRREEEKKERQKKNMAKDKEMKSTVKRIVGLSYETKDD